MTTSLSRSSWQPEGDYDNDARWRDDQDGGDRWRAFAACRDVDPAQFFPVVTERRRIGDEIVEVPTDEEPSFPPPDVKAICDRCPVRGKCLDRYMDEEFGVYGGTTGYQRQLLTKKIVRKRCPGCGSEDLVQNRNQQKEVCLACSLSWDVL